MEVEIIDVRDRLPEIGKEVKVFYEMSAYNSHGVWMKVIRNSETHFSTGHSELPIDFSDRKGRTIGVIYWTLELDKELPHLCRLHSTKCD
jgi:hypothetical protein